MATEREGACVESRDAGTHPAAPKHVGPIIESYDGIVTFYNGSDVLGRRGVSAGVATLDTSSLALGGHGVFAVYSGATGYAASSSDAVNIVITTPEAAPT